MVVNDKLLDTNIILYLLGGRLAEPLPKGNSFVSVITEIELLSYPDLDRQTEQKIRDLKHFLFSFPLRLCGSA